MLCTGIVESCPLLPGVHHDPEDEIMLREFSEDKTPVAEIHKPNQFWKALNQNAIREGFQS